MEDVDRSLTLLHLRKTFSEYCRMPLNGSKDGDRKFDRLLPLFGRVMAMYPSPEEIVDKFKELCAFTGHLCRHLVQEIRLRAANECTRLAASAILNFLLPDVADCRGWTLLNAACYLSCTKQEQVIEVMCKAALPSTLVKALYLFFDLPPAANEDVAISKQKLFVVFQKVLKKLCEFNCVSEELTRKDDLFLLFAGASCACPTENVEWREAISHLLVVVVSRSLSSSVTKYIHAKNCISVFLSNICKEDENLLDQERIGMFICLLSVLKDSATTVNVLLQDFARANGYLLLRDFILKYAENKGAEEGIKNILILIMSMTTCGTAELKPNYTPGLIVLPTFNLPIPSNNGLTLCNVDALHLLFQIFIQCKNEWICEAVVDAVHNIYASDTVNYFIADKECPLSQMIERMGSKSLQIQRKVMELIEYVVLHLSHIPCKELIALSVLLKTEISDNSLECCILFLQSAFRILSANALLKDAFREVGLVESLTWAVLHFISIDKTRPLSESEGRVALLSTDILSLLVSSNLANACAFRENAGSKAIIDLICSKNDEWRASALQLMKQLLISGQSEEQLTALLLVLHTPTLDNMALKAILLKSLLCALRESHKVRLMFRRSGGYLCLMSLLISLEGKLRSNVEETISEVFLAEIANFLRFTEIIFKVLAISMRYEPSNSKYFSHEVTWDNLCLALRVSGAFMKDVERIDAEHVIWQAETSEIQSKVEACHKMFDFNESFNSGCLPPDEIPTSIFIALSMIRFLVSLALDSYEKPEAVWPSNSGSAAGDQCASLASWTAGVLVHPGALISVLHLLPAIQSSTFQWAAAAQYYCALLIKALLRPERNQQIMCQSNMAQSILKIGVNVFKSEKHLMLAPFYYVLERLSSHAITPSDLRSFLRLGMPLCCRNLDETEGEEPVTDDEGGSISIARVKALVSMMTPRDHRIAQNPSFVEFDMAPEGFASLVIPSLAPLSTDFGIGRGERIFPPLNGLTVMMWLCVEQFSDKRIDPHPIRLLTIYRSFNSSKKEDGSKQNPSLVCLSMQLSSIDRSLLICTAESETAGNDLEKERNIADENLIRIALGDAICIGQWTHIAVVLTRSVLKHSQAAIYINGRLEGTYKLHYIIQNVGGGAAHLSYANGVYAVIGTPPVYRSQSRLCFKIATFVIVEEPVSAEAIIRIYDLEPHYIGNFQTVSGDTPLIAEERICLSLSAVANKELSVSRIGSIYSKADSAFIARYIGVSIHDRSTPLRILLNTVTHAPGPARSFGAVLLGYLGIRLFTPFPVTRLLDCVGGISCLFGLVAMATTSQELYASLKALTTAVKTDKITSRHLITTRSYQILAMLLEGKTELLNSHILHLILSLVGTLDTSKDTSIIPNLSVFEDMLCDLDVWKDASPDLNRLLYEHFYELITDQNSENLNMVLRSSLPSRLLIRLFDHPNLIFAVNDIVFNLLAALLQPPADSLLLLKVGQLMAATLPIPGSDQNETSYAFSITDLQAALFASKHSSHFDRLLYDIYVRNRILNIIANTLTHSSVNNNLLLCDLVVKTLGFDWVLALFTPGVHYTTVVLGLRILLALLKHDHLMQKFKEGSANGGWLTDADSFVRNRAAVLLGFSVSAYGGNVGAHVDINPELSECGGFIMLEHLLHFHYKKPQCYLAMLALLVGQPISSITLVDNFSLDLIWSHVFGLSLSSSVSEAVSGIEICCEAVIPLLSMVRAAIHANGESPHDDNKLVYSSTVIQMFTFLYQNCPNFCNLCHTEEFITYLFCVLVPLNVMESSTIKDENSLSPSFYDMHVVLEESCCRNVLDLIKRILYEDIYRNHGAKPDSLLDALIENIPEYGCSRRFCTFVLSENLSLCMEYMIATDVLLESEKPSTAATCGTSAATSAVLLANFAYFASRIVDCVWSGIYIGEASRVLSFLLKGLALTRRNDPKSISYDSLMQSLDRVILYLLSRPIDNVNVQMSILNTLSEIILHRNVILSPTHNDPLFFGSLTHLLFMLSVTPDILPKKEGSSNLDRGSAQVALCASQVWKEVCAVKRNLLEDVFRSGLVTELNAARALLSHAASLEWLSFVDSQMNSSPKSTMQFQQQIQSKITKVATGLQRLATRKTLSSSNSICSFTLSRQPNITTEVVQMWLRVHISLIRELVRTQCLCYHEWHSHVQKWCMQDWRSLEMELIRERGIWGAELGSSLDKYMLDMTEGPCRIRRKLIPNPTFYHHYPYRPHLDSPEAKAMRAKVAVSKDSKLYYAAIRRRRGKIPEPRIIDLSAMVYTPSEECSDLLFTDMQEISTSMIRRVSIKHALSKDSDETECVVNEKDVNEADEENVEENGVDEEHSIERRQAANEQKNGTRENEGMTIKAKDGSIERKRGPDNQTLLRLLEQGEQLHSMFRCARVQGLDTSEGLLLFGRQHYYVVDGFTLLKTREIRDLDFLLQELHDPIVPYMACGTSHPVRRTRLCSKFSYNDIREVHRRRYLLQPIAIEVFSADGRNYLLAFPRRMRNRVYQKFLSLARLLKDNGSESVGGQRSTAPMEQTSRVSLLTSFIGQQSVTHRWVRGEISNFQYLMHLNTLAGRSYNDLSQYPVFPWILRDYESEDLNLTDPRFFRDLSKPMGAQNLERLEQFLKRYREWDDPTGETPAYMYGTHYSSAMIVVSYLVRLEPFTQQFLKLQGGHFDLADRMFHSVGDAWLSASRNNMADVKELIPEFFSLPEMFLNSNHFDFGVKQNGVALNDVVLPAWAKGDAREFVRMHRQALECDYVSANLHNWIDLIFGYKQRGDAAAEANNIYHHLFYEGNVDFDSIEDPLTRNATIGFINNFGQIPSQLFKKPHPQKKVAYADIYSSTPGVTTQRLFYHSFDSLKVPAQPIKELKSAVGSLVPLEKGGVLALETNRILLLPNRYISWGFPDRSIRIGSIDNDRSTCVYELSESAEITCCACGDSRTVFTGSSTGKVCVWDLTERHPRIRFRRTLTAHTEAITALVVCSAQTLLVSGSRDGTAIVWHLSALTFIRQLRLHPSAVTAVAINDTTGDILTASGSTLFLWSINGRLLSVIDSVDTASFGQFPNVILSLSFSTLYEWDPENVVMCGGSDGIVRIYCLEFVRNEDDLDPKASRLPATLQTNINNMTTLQRHLERQRQRLQLLSSEASSSNSPSAGSQTDSPEPLFDPSINLYDDERLDCSWKWQEGEADRSEKLVWKKLLVPKFSLTTHTAFNRKDNPHPASITAITPSRDHRTLFVGDSAGRVWSWQIGDEVGARADHWIQDPSRSSCTQCMQKFSLAERRHHCRNCGHIFCNRCSRFETDIKHMKISKPVRVCQSCFLRLKAEGVS
ncbi:Beige/BEACH domain family protein [Acanthocheilonema viteae]